MIARMRRRRHTLIAAALVLAISYVAFGGPLPFRSHYEIRGVFTSANQLRPGSDVRIAGMPIGTVRSIDAGPGHSAVVTMRITGHTVPIRANAHLAIEPRLALEGNYYVAVSPGTPDAPKLPGGGEIPVTNTTTPVQLDQVLSTMTVPVRRGLTDVLGAMDAGLSKGGAAGLQRAAHELDGALRDATPVLHALRGTRNGDLPGAVRGVGDFTGQLSQDPTALAGVVTSYGDVLRTFAGAERSLAVTVTGSDALLRAAPASLTAIDAALPALTRFAGALRGTLNVAPAALRDANASLDQLVPLLSGSELPRLVTRLAPALATMPTFERRLGALFPLLTRASRCVSRTIVPTFDATIPDGSLSTKQPVWQEMLHMAAAFAGLAEGFDGNGSNVRLGVSEDYLNALQAQIPGLGTFAGHGQISGISPTWLGVNVEPPFRPDAWCDSQARPNLGLRRAPGVPEGFREFRGPKPSALDARLHAALYARNKSGILAALERMFPALRNVPPAKRAPLPHVKVSRPGPLPALPTPSSPTRPALPKLPTVPQLPIAKDVTKITDTVHRLLGGMN